ncbi:MAG: glycosyltransferase family A protein [Gemmataceae bacterium]|nr:glycosyltransferase family 2 protein [Gemmata sp.]MDW8198074.1 glycosyltransferase family A protein [Gemmataceae bacterium]
MTPRLSVIIAAYNCGPYLPAAIDSLLHQTLRPHEIIVVDDGSTDETPAVLARYAERIIMIRQANAGETAARNRALEAATGDFVAVLDADDISAPTRLEKQAAALTDQPDAIACVTGFWRFSDTTAHLAGIDGDDRATTAEVPDFWTDAALVCAGSVMFHRHKAEGLRYPPGIRSGGDMLFLGMLRSRGRVVVLKEHLYGYRVRPGSASHVHSDIDGFQARWNWAKDNWRTYWPAGSEAELERRFWFHLAELTERVYWARRREPFLKLRAFLSTHWPAHLPAPSVTRWRWYPDWLWKAKETIDRVLRYRPALRR